MIKVLVHMVDGCITQILTDTQDVRVVVMNEETDSSYNDNNEAVMVSDVGNAEVISTDKMYQLWKKQPDHKETKQDKEEREEAARLLRELDF
jgi:hypothetical protein